MIKILVFKKFNSIICLFNNLFCICGIGNIYLKKNEQKFQSPFSSEELLQKSKLTGENIVFLSGFQI